VLTRSLTGVREIFLSLLFYNLLQNAHKALKLIMTFSQKDEAWTSGDGVGMQFIVMLATSSHLLWKA